MIFSEKWTFWNSYLSIFKCHKSLYYNSSGSPFTEIKFLIFSPVGKLDEDMKPFKLQALYRAIWRCISGRFHCKMCKRGKNFRFSIHKKSHWLCFFFNYKIASWFFKNSIFFFALPSINFSNNCTQSLTINSLSQQHHGLIIHSYYTLIFYILYVLLWKLLEVISWIKTR